MTTHAKAGIFKPKAYTTTKHPLPIIPFPCESKTIKQALQDPIWLQSMQVEFDALQKTNTWTLVPFDSHMTVLTNKWVFRVKLKAGGYLDKCKSRLVAKGFLQTLAIDYSETFSPVIKPAIVKLVFSLALSHTWPIKQLDVSNAFLNGDLYEVVYMAQPEGFVNPSFPTHVCKLHKSLYGLKQAPRAWNDKLWITLLKRDFVDAKADTSLFISGRGDSLLLLLVYVDDILITGPNQLLIS